MTLMFVRPDVTRMGEPASMRAARAAECTNEAAQAALLAAQYSGDSYTNRSVQAPTAWS